MNERIDLLAQHLFKRPSFDACTREELLILEQQYPYFSAVPLMLLKKLRPETEAYKAQKQKAALHVYSPLLLENWIHPEQFETRFAFPEADTAVAEKVPELTVPPVVETAPEPALTQTAPVPLAATVTTEAATAAVPPPAAPEIPVAEAVLETVPAPEPGADLMPEAPVVELPSPAETPAAVVAPEAEAVSMEAVEAEQPEVQAAAGSAEAEQAPAPTFEPFHTVDYFASQGIRLSQQEAGQNGQFGKQLKSFTEWLKTMKKLPVTAVAQQPEGVGEKNIASLAEHSLSSADIITESMAEVWTKQGNTEKAAEVYRKLSLLNPSKSAYFAAKIESLKKPTT